MTSPPVKPEMKFWSITHFDHEKQAQELERLAEEHGLRGFIDVSEEVYHKSPGISNTGLSWIAMSPAHYEVYRDDPPPRTPALILGAAIHRAILEPERFENMYAGEPKFDKRTKVGQAAYKEWLENEGNGKEALKIEDMETCLRIRDAASRNIVLRNMLDYTQGKAEQSMYWYDGFIEEDVQGNVLCRARCDFVRIGDDIICDVKSTLDASAESFGRTVHNRELRYYKQAAFYSDGYKEITGRTPQFVFIAVEKQKPYGVGIYVLEPDAVTIGRSEYRSELLTYMRCKKKNEWPCYPATVQTLFMPSWFLKP